MPISQKKFFQILYWIVKVVFPVNLVIFPLIALYGHFNSWAPANEILSQYPDETVVMVGIGLGGESTSAGETIREVSYSERSYILVPSVVNDPKILTIRKYDKQSVQVTESKIGFMFLVVWYVLCIFGTWWFWIRKQDQKGQTRLKYE